MLSIQSIRSAEEEDPEKVNILEDLERQYSKKTGKQRPMKIDEEIEKMRARLSNLSGDEDEEIRKEKLEDKEQPKVTIRKEKERSVSVWKEEQQSISKSIIVIQEV